MDVAVETRLKSSRLSGRTSSSVHRAVLVATKVDMTRALNHVLMMALLPMTTSPNPVVVSERSRSMVTSPPSMSQDEIVFCFASTQYSRLETLLGEVLSLIHI